MYSMVVMEGMDGRYEWNGMEGMEGRDLKTLSPFRWESIKTTDPPASNNIVIANPTLAVGVGSCPAVPPNVAMELLLHPGSAS
jgi:hypothetical protein